MSDKCPKCGAKKHSGVSRFTWACGSIHAGHSKQCKDRQIAALTARVEGLQQEFSDTAVKLAYAEDKLVAVKKWLATSWAVDSPFVEFSSECLHELAAILAAKEGE